MYTDVVDDLSWDQQIYQSHESVMDKSTIEHRDICSSLKQSPASLPRKKSRVPKQGKVFFPSATIFLGVNLLLVSGSLKEGIYIYYRDGDTAQIVLWTILKAHHVSGVFTRCYSSFRENIYRFGSSASLQLFCFASLFKGWNDTGSEEIIAS